MSSTIDISEPLNANMGGKARTFDNGSLVHYIMPIVRGNREIRDRKMKTMWDKYERTFRGLYSGADKTREGERSRLVAPALAAAIESTAATIEDAIFSRDEWFQTLDDVADPQNEDIAEAHRLLKEDLDLAGVPDAIAKCVLNGCLYGTGIGKINVTRREIRSFTPEGIKKEFRPLVTLEAIPPWEFVIDSQARDIHSALFVAHETHVPRNVVQSRIARRIYRDVNIFGNSTTSTHSPAGIETPDGTRKSEGDDGSVFITEYYGLVPAAALRGIVKVKPEDIQGDGKVEVMVTIANELELLRAVVNPFALKDRPIIAYQHSVVPGQFWGRGVAEKGWNAQRALDAELRARMDALGLLTSPMLGADLTRLPRNPDMRVRPGKVWLTRGQPSQVIEPILLGNIDPNTFNQSSEMERLIQVGTGSMESNAPINENRRNETASGISMIQSSSLKRMRRTMWNMERQFLNPLIRKIYHRYMQFNPQRYKNDVEFVIKGTMGIVAREFEQSNLTALLSVVSPDHPNYNIILRGVIELSGTPKRDELLKAMEEASKPTPEAQRMQQIQQEAAEEGLKEAKLENAKTQMEVLKLQAEIEQIKAQTSLEDEQMDINAMNAIANREKVKMMKLQDETNRIKIKSEEKTKLAQARAQAKKPTGS